MAWAVNEVREDYGDERKRDRFGITALVVAVLLLLALGDWPYGYYQFLRLSACAFSVAVAYRAHQADRIGWLLFGAAGAILFNPVFPVEMDRKLWAIPDIVFGGAYAFYGWRATFTQEERRRWLPRLAGGALAVVALIAFGIWQATRPTVTASVPDRGLEALESSPLDASDDPTAIDYGSAPETNVTSADNPYTKLVDAEVNSNATAESNRENAGINLGVIEEGDTGALDSGCACTFSTGIYTVLQMGGNGIVTKPSGKTSFTPIPETLFQDMYQTNSGEFAIAGYSVTLEPRGKLVPGFDAHAIPAQLRISEGDSTETIKGDWSCGC